MRTLGYLLTLACAAPLMAQDSGVGAFGLGWGRGTITCTTCTSNGTYGGFTINLGFGKTVNPHLRVLFDYNEWGHPPTSGTGVTGSDLGKIAENFTATAQYFPWTVRHGFFVEGGLGLTVAKIWVTDTSGLSRHGWGFTTGAGYDLFPDRSLSFTPTIAFSYGSVGRIDYPVHSGNLWADGWKHEILSLGLGLTYHRRPKGPQKGTPPCDASSPGDCS